MRPRQFLEESILESEILFKHRLINIKQLMRRLNTIKKKYLKKVLTRENFFKKND